MEAIEARGDRDPLVGRVTRLFEFLARSQQLKARPPRTLDRYESVLWLGDLPDHPAVRMGHRAEHIEFDHEIFTIDRVPHHAAPEPDNELRPWLSGPANNPDIEPRLRESLGEEQSLVKLEDVPELDDAYLSWLEQWQSWAAQELLDRPARTAYKQLFSTYIAANGNSEELELVVGVGCLTWAPIGHDPIKRHLLTAPVVIHFDDDTGRLTVRRAESVDEMTVELDMLDPGRVANPQHINQVKADARVLEASPVDREVVGALARRLVHALDGDGLYLDEDSPVGVPDHAAVSFAPAMILRKRSKQGTVEILTTIAAQLAEADDVPDGLRPLVDPDHRPAASSSPEPGALVHVDNDPFLPMQVNEKQLHILRQVDTRAQTVVQGPPGTGKTYTAAALISHLLAQGKRVLVTAHTDRALREVRGKLPAAIAPLVVSVVGSSRSDLSDLEVAVERIGEQAGDHDPVAARKSIEEHLAEIDRFRRQRASLNRRLLDAREHEVTEHVRDGYRGTLAAIALQIDAQRGRFAWLCDVADIGPDSKPPVNTADVVEWHRSLMDDALRADEPEARLRLVDVANVPDPDPFAALVTAERSAISAEQELGALTQHTAFDAVHRLDEAARDRLRQRLSDLAREAEELSGRCESWMNDALLDVRSGRALIWQSRANEISALIARLAPLVDRLGPLTDVDCNGDLGPLAALAAALRQYVGTGGKLKTNADGSPRTGAFAPKPVKQAQPLFERVRVNGVPPTTAEQLDAFLDWRHATRSLDALDKAWPDTVAIPAEDTLRERLQWHVTELAQLHRVLRLGNALQVEERHLAELGLPKPEWNDLLAVRTYAQLVNAAAASDARAAASMPLTRIEHFVRDVARWSDAAPCVAQLQEAVLNRDHELYRDAYRRLTRVHEVRRAVRRRDEIDSRLNAAVPALRTSVERDLGAEWSERLSSWEDAWAWAATRAWVLAQRDADVNDLQAEVAATEGRIRVQVEHLAAARAWIHAVSPQRLSGQARADLQQYAQLVRALGKGTGKYAARRKTGVRAAMDRCRPAVPVWIMPIYRIAEQLRIQRDMFDVVVVDEASQAGLEATFLQYLAPKIVVIGDDMQVSPAAVGVDQQQLRDLANQYLWDDRYIESWLNPKRSLFDEAKMRFEGLVTLTEHRRCVPEIIGFSNRIAYEPKGIRLIPVRQYGADRLEPIKTVFLDEGYEKGVTDKVNPVEVDAIVDQIEKCIADPRYDGRTFGVISLLGRAQAATIEKRLMERVPPEEWTARELRCGDSADFQGSERDVMFLSMVKAVEPGKRIGALTQDLYVQRFNVAASRAKDQMWVFHSVRLSDLTNTEDMRFQLLDYCCGVVKRTTGEHDGVLGSTVPEDRRVEPFDSLFEQRVFNRLADRGYSVVPQYPAMGYRLDLVVVGAKARVAVECDGDAWHGPDAYERDLARQRDLERCGWRFFRVGESEFYVDPSAVLGNLWTTLEELDIHPSGWTREVDEVADPAPTPELPAVAVMDPAEAVTQPAVVDEEAEIGVDGLPPSADAPATTEPILAAYHEFEGNLVSVDDATRQQLLDGVEGIVSVEGPVLGHRLHSAYVKAAGGQRVGHVIASELNKAIASAVRRGRLVQDNPLGEAGVKPRTYRLPDQPVVRIRQVGPRLFGHIPPGELAALLDHVATTTGLVDEESLYRATLELLGLKRLTDNVRKRFTSVRVLLTLRK